MSGVLLSVHGIMYGALGAGFGSGHDGSRFLREIDICRSRAIDKDEYR